MGRIMVAAPRSGCGKTTLSCGLLTLAVRKGLNTGALKIGPDYIDPMFHCSVSGIPCKNLDLFLCPEERAQSLSAEYFQRFQFTVLEGAMGYFDGLGGTTDIASASHAAHITQTPVILVLEPKGASLSLCAQALGFINFDKPCCIQGLFLNRCTKAMFQLLSPMLEKHTGLPVVGYLPPMPEIELPSRHLGLMCAEELPNLQQKLNRTADILEDTLNWELMLQIADSAPSVLAVNAEFVPQKQKVCRIAVARDKAFCFYYEEGLEALRNAGAELVFFSPLADSQLPENCGGLYLGGGYPEIYAEELSLNTSLTSQIKAFIEDGIPTIAECGGFLYLQKTLEDTNGKAFPLVGVLDGDGFKTDRLQRFGYTELTAKNNSMLFNDGETFPAHEFHHWDCTQNGVDLLSQKPISNRHWDCGVCSDTLYAAFPHLYFYGHPVLAERFVAAAAKYKNRAEQN